MRADGARAGRAREGHAKASGSWRARAATAPKASVDTTRCLPRKQQRRRARSKKGASIVSAAAPPRSCVCHHAAVRRVAPPPCVVISRYPGAAYARVARGGAALGARRAAGRSGAQTKSERNAYRCLLSRVAGTRCTRLLGARRRGCAWHGATRQASAQGSLGGGARGHAREPWDLGIRHANQGCRACFCVGAR